MRRSASNNPKPQSSTPQLFDTTWSSCTPARRSSAISVDGMPQSPNPPTAMVAPSEMSATACSATTTLSIRGISFALRVQQLTVVR
jgi:hypothetical protein